MRIVSLLPSATEMLLAMAPGAVGASRENDPEISGVSLVGRSHECDWPNSPELLALPALTRAATTFSTAAQVDREVREAVAAGRPLYHLDTERLAALKPDLILTQDLCAVCSIDLESVRAAARALPSPARVLSFNPQGIEGVLEDLVTLGAAIGREQAAMELVVRLRDRMDRAQERVPAFAPRPRVAFLEWTDPLYCAGHWTPQLIERAGGEHPLNPTRAAEWAGAGEGIAGQTARQAGPSVRVPPEVLSALAPEYLFIAPCGLSLEECERQTRALAGREWFESLPAVRRARAGDRSRVWCIDGNQMFNRPGPRLVEALEFLVDVLQGRAANADSAGSRGPGPAGFPARGWRPD